MTRCVLFLDAAGQYRGFEVEGHAGFAPKGYDIVCAALSSLTTTCVNALESVAGVVPQVNCGEEGQLSAFLPQIADAQKLHACQVLFGALRQGLDDLTDAYPEYVKLTIRIISSNDRASMN